ncbi:MAG: hypothetical protein AAF950_18345 [Pseudomonadota bacterium]
MLRILVVAFVLFVTFGCAEQPKSISTPEPKAEVVTKPAVLSEVDPTPEAPSEPGSGEQDKWLKKSVKYAWCSAFNAAYAFVLEGDTGKRKDRRSNAKAFDTRIATILNAYPEISAEDLDGIQSAFRDSWDEEFKESNVSAIQSHRTERECEQLYKNDAAAIAALQ